MWTEPAKPPPRYEHMQNRIRENMRKFVTGQGPYRSTISAPYGYCPQCKSPGRARELGPHGVDICAKGHKYKSDTALGTLEYHDGQTD